MFLLRENSLTQSRLSSSAPLILPLHHLFFSCTTYPFSAPLILPLHHLFFPCTTYSSPAPLILPLLPLSFPMHQLAFPCTAYPFPYTNIWISWKCLYLRINKTAKTYIFYEWIHIYIYNYNKTIMTKIFSTFFILCVKDVHCMYVLCCP